MRLSSVSGYLKEGDLVVLGTSEFVGLVDEFRIGELRENGRPAEVLAPSVHAKDDSSGMAGVVLERGEVEKRKGEKKRKVRRGLGFLARVKERFLGEGIRVRREKRKGWSVKVGLVVLALLFLSVGLGIWRRKEVVQARSYKKLEGTVQQRLEEAGSVVDLNPERSKYLINQSKQELEVYLEEEEDGEYKKKAQKLKKFVERREEEIFRKREVEVSEYVALGVLSEGGSFRGFAMDDKGDVLMYEKKGGVVWGLSLEDKSSFSVGEGLEGGLDVAYQRENVYVLTSEGVFEAPVEGGSFEQVIEKDEMWKGPAFLDVYAGNVYVLDKGAGEVWKYPVLEEGWGARRRWFGKGIVLDLSGVEEFFVDGDIWFLTASGKLQRFSRGVPQDLSLEGFPSLEEEGLFKSPRDLYVTEEKVYVLETGGERVVELEKSGKYVGQYVSERFGEGEELVIYEGKGYVRTGEKIVVFGLGG